MCKFVLMQSLLTCSFKVRVYNVPADEALGPVHARAMQSRMVLEEASFCMQVNAHILQSEPFKYQQHTFICWSQETH